MKSTRRSTPCQCGRCVRYRKQKAKERKDKRLTAAIEIESKAIVELIAAATMPSWPLRADSVLNTDLARILGFTKEKV